MNGARPLAALALACTLVPAMPRTVAADAPAPLDYRAYDGWNAIRTPRLSDDGTKLAYALTPQDGDPTLVVRDLDDGSERREPRGSSPAFAGGSRFVVFTRVAPKKDVDAAKRAKKPEAQQPKNGLGILDLRAPGSAQSIESIKSFAVAKNGGAVIAFRAEPSPAPSESPSAGPSATPSGVRSPSASPSASPSPKADKTKAPGALLTIADLPRGTSLHVADVSEFTVSDDDRFVAYATESKAGAGDGMHVYDVARGVTIDVLRGPGRYSDLALAPDGTAVAFLSDDATYAGDVPHDALYVADLRAATPVALKAVDAVTAGLPAQTTPNANGPLAFSRDGKRLFLGTAAVPTPQPSGTPEPMKVDLWSWRDDVLQSQQKHDAEKERKRTYLAVYDLDARRFAQLGSPSLTDVVRNENADVALGRDDRAYRRATSWLGQDYSDLYAVSLATGARRPIARRASEGDLSPDGRYALAWDAAGRHWVAIATRDGRRVTLAAHAPVAFHDVEDDHPEPAQPYGNGGWLAGDRGVLLYDRYDVWLADPRTGAATNLTRGAGRRTGTVYSPIELDPDALAFAPDKPILLTLLDTRTYASGYARVAPQGGVPETLLKADQVVYGTRPAFESGLHDLGFAPVAAKHADRIVFSRESFREYRDLWASDSMLHRPVKVTDANPQLAHFRWGSERLISYKGPGGKELRAVMLVPDGLARDRKAPMLVYFYERFSDMYHTFYSPAPGTSPNFSRYVSNGYVVLLPDVTYRVGRPGASALDSILPAVDAAVRTGYVNPQRVGIAGHSWAAYQINYMITKTDRFRAVEAGAAVDDMISAYGGIRLESGIVRESQYEHTQSRIGAAPWERPDLYIANSGLFGIARVRTPYLTIHNDQDGAVPQFQGIEYVTAMRRLGKEAYLFSFDGEDHNLRGREQQKYWTVHLDEWFDYWLKGAPRPGWMDGVDYLHRGERNVRPLYGETDQ